MILFFVKDPRLSAYVAADDYAEAVDKWKGRLLFTAEPTPAGRTPLKKVDCNTDPEHVSRLGGTERYIP